MMEEFIRWPKPYLLLSATYHETLSWMIGNWMNFHLVSDDICKTVIFNPPQNTRGMTNNVGLTFGVGDIIYTAVYN